ncbi:MCE family protein [Rhodococcus sp. X156]|uniref:MCE family protein n=1 Tax=Rhodococcus sp. X156 TaxID=2499145 RepID=UPI000FDC4A58|nr:MCE family protein [Rhodococcus sp. X156]
MTSARSTLVKLGVFTTVMVLILAGLVVIFGQIRFTPTTSYQALFTNASGIKTGERVRIAGVPVGTVNGVKVTADNTAQVDFEVDTKYRLAASTKAVVRYENLTGDRYLELLEGSGNPLPLEDGDSIPASQTTPALDLDELLNGFKPLFRALDPAQVNQLSSEIIMVLQGQGGTVQSVLARTGSLTNTLANRDQLIGQVVTNLNTVLDTVATRSTQFDTTVTQLQQLVSGLSGDRAVIGDALNSVNTGTNQLTSLLLDGREPLQGAINQGNRLATVLDEGKGEIDSVVSRLPETYAALVRTGVYGSFFQFYLCQIVLKLTGPDGKPTTVTLNDQKTGRCAA